MVRILQDFNWPIADLEVSRLGKPVTGPTVVKGGRITGHWRRELVESELAHLESTTPSEFIGDRSPRLSAAGS